jgi:hypothetical protein
MERCHQGGWFVDGLSNWARRGAQVFNKQGLAWCCWEADVEAV